MQKGKTTTKECPECKTTNLLKLPSMNIKICVDCHITIPWYLEDQQQPLIKAQR
jgi:ribosomal protein L37AE/L43A